ncbi:MAG: NAD(P)-binding domain-containing protein [Thermovirgaceae bacterium]
MNIGFLGTGEIATKLVTGLCTSDTPPDRVFLSPRNTERAQMLAEKFNQVHVASNNQSVVDESECLFLSIRPHLMEKVLCPLRFRNNQKIVSLLAGIRLLELRSCVTQAKKLLRSAPLPYNSRHIGPIVLYPGDQEVEKLFSGIGRVVTVESERELDILTAVTSLMVPYYRLIQETVMWAEQLGMAREQAVSYTAEMFQSLSLLIKEEKTDDFDALLEKYTTKGGLNELALKTILNEDGYTPWKKALVAVQGRLGLEKASTDALDGK